MVAVEPDRLPTVEAHRAVKVREVEPRKTELASPALDLVAIVRRQLDQLGLVGNFALAGVTAKMNLFGYHSLAKQSVGLLEWSVLNTADGW